MHHAEGRLGIKMGSTTADGKFTLERAECQAACTEAPTLQVNYRHRYRVTPEAFDDLVATGRDTETVALSKAVKYHLEHRVFLNQDRTVIFR